MQRTPRTVLVTGTSTGIGRATAALLARQGYRVYAGTRGRPSVAGAADAPPELTAGPCGPSGGSIELVQLDVTSQDDVDRVVAWLARETPEGLFALVNNAGRAAPAAVELTDLDELRNLLEVNALGPLRLIHACLPLLRKARGRVVNMSSMNGTVALPMVGAYSASKFALEALSDALRVELRPWGIAVTVIRPGQVRTAIFDKARTALQERTVVIPPALAHGYGALYARASQFNERGSRRSNDPERVARVVLHALTVGRPKAHYTVGFDAWGLSVLKSWLPPRVFNGLLAWVSGVPSRPGAMIAVDERASGSEPRGESLRDSLSAAVE